MTISKKLVREVYEKVEFNDTADDFYLFFRQWVEDMSNSGKFKVIFSQLIEEIYFKYRNEVNGIGDPEEL